MIRLLNVILRKLGSSARVEGSGDTQTWYKLSVGTGLPPSRTAELRDKTKPAPLKSASSITYIHAWPAQEMAPERYHYHYRSRQMP